MTATPTCCRFLFASPIGPLLIEETDGAISEVSTRPRDAAPDQPATALLKQARKELQEYFAGTRQTFDLPLKPSGTDFEKAVWAQLRCIPYGQVRSYGDIARACGHPQSFRAVGRACNRNRILILTPCHRVIGQDGKLVGFGCGLPIKEKLLTLEGVDLLRLRKMLQEVELRAVQDRLPGF